GVARGEAIEAVDQLRELIVPPLRLLVGEAPDDVPRRALVRERFLLRLEARQVGLHPSALGRSLLLRELRPRRRDALRQERLDLVQIAGAARLRGAQPPIERGRRRERPRPRAGRGGPPAGRVAAR